MGLRDKFKKKKPGEILEKGWQFYHAPTTLEPVGTVFRIDKDNVRYKVTNLKIPSVRGKEATVRITKNSEIGLGLLVKFLSIALQGKLKASKGEKIEFELKDPERETTSDVDVQHVLPQLVDVEFLKDSKYYIIRECRFGTGMKYQLSNKSLMEIGGELKVNAAIQGKGQVKRKTDSTFEIPHDFPEPMRVMFLPAEIKPSTVIISKPRRPLGSMKGGGRPGLRRDRENYLLPPSDEEKHVRELKLVPVESDLVWEDSDE